MEFKDDSLLKAMLLANIQKRSLNILRCQKQDSYEIW